MVRLLAMISMLSVVLCCVVLYIYTQYIIYVQMYVCETCVSVETKRVMFGGPRSTFTIPFLPVFACFVGEDDGIQLLPSNHDLCGIEVRYASISTAVFIIYTFYEFCCTRMRLSCQSIEG